MSVKIGKLAKVVLNGATILGIGSFSFSGFSVDQVEVTAFGDQAKNFIPTIGDAGDVTVTGFYNPDDTTGQIALEAACIAGTELGPGVIKFYIDTNTYLTPSNLGVIIITKTKAISMDKAGVAQITFSAKLSGGGWEQLND